MCIKAEIAIWRQVENSASGVTGHFLSSGEQLATNGMMVDERFFASGAAPWRG
jgi:hypothetical protein